MVHVDLCILKAQVKNLSRTLPQVDLGYQPTVQPQTRYTYMYQGFPTHQPNQPFTTVSFTLATSPRIEQPIFAIVYYTTCFEVHVCWQYLLENGYKTLYASGTPDVYRLKDLPLYYDAIITPFLCLCILLHVYINVHAVLQYFNQCYQIKEVKPPQKCPKTDKNFP